MNDSSTTSIQAFAERMKALAQDKKGEHSFSHPLPFTIRDDDAVSALILLMSPYFSNVSVVEGVGAREIRFSRKQP